jgi:hypothetical protein
MPFDARRLSFAGIVAGSMALTTNGQQLMAHLMDPYKPMLKTSMSSTSGPVAPLTSMPTATSQST